MRTLVVQTTDPQADARSLTQAFALARAGDTVLVNPGIYSPARTGEQLPLKIPAGVTVLGTDKEACIVDGEGRFAPSFNPIRTDLAVIELADGAWVSNLTVTNGGGHGIAAPPGASISVTNCTISQHGDHGLYICGVTEAVVINCEFLNNGRQRAVGETQRNRCEVMLEGNRIANCGKNAVRLVGAIGGDNVRTEENQVQASVSRNILSGGALPVVLQGAGGTAKSLPQRNSVTACLIGNVTDGPSENTCAMSDGHAGNTVEIIEGSQEVTRKEGNLLT